MKHKIIISALVTTLGFSSYSAERDDPVVTMLKIDQLEVRSIDGPDPLVLEGDVWFGKDLNKIWFKVDAEQVDGDTEEAELQALYSKVISPYWDIQLGVRHDFRPEPERDWLVAGLMGVAPYFFEVDAALFLGEQGRSAIRLQAEYEGMITQKLVLSPEIEINAYGKDDEQTGIGSGVSDLQLGLRLRYEIKREFAPYIGINWIRLFGKTADLAEDEGEDTNDVHAVVGLRAWF